MLLQRNGTCNSITTYEQSIAGRDKPSRMAAARVLLDHFYDELCESVRGDIARHEATLGLLRRGAPRTGDDFGPNATGVTRGDGDGAGQFRQAHGEKGGIRPGCRSR
jgi:hypothetical protein